MECAGKLIYGLRAGHSQNQPKVNSEVSYDSSSDMSRKQAETVSAPAIKSNHAIQMSEEHSQVDVFKSIVIKATMEYTQKWFEQNQQCRQAFSENAKKSSKDGKKKSSGFKGDCHHCKKLGHKAADCYKKHPELKKRKQKNSTTNAKNTQKLSKQEAPLDLVIQIREIAAKLEELELSVQRTNRIRHNSAMPSRITEDGEVLHLL